MSRQSRLLDEIIRATEIKGAAETAERRLKEAPSHLMAAPLPFVDALGEGICEEGDPFAGFICWETRLGAADGTSEIAVLEALIVRLANRPPNVDGSEPMTSVTHVGRCCQMAIDELRRGRTDPKGR